MPSSELLPTRRGEFELLIDGPANGVPVLLLHGFPELNLSWRHQLPALAEAGYRAIAPNQRGYAGSVRGGSYATADLADDIAAMLDALAVERAVVVGHDWGGGVAWTFAARHPDRISALVALNCPPPSVLGHHLTHDRRQIAKSWYMFYFQLPVLPERFVVKHMPGMLVAGSFNRGAWNRETLRPYAQAFTTPDDAHGPVNWYRGALRGAFRRNRRRGSRIAAPVLVIWGTQDRFLGRELVSPSALRPVLAYGNDADVVWIEAAGHYVQNEAPDEVTAALLGWLGGHRDEIRPS